MPAALLCWQGLPRRGSLGRMAAAWLVALAWAAAAPAAATRPVAEATEASVKAAYLHKFLPYVEWPAGALGPAGEPLVIGVLGAPAVLAELEAVVAGRPSQGRTVLTRRLEPGDALDAVHMLYLGRGVTLPAPLLGPAPRPLLVVTDAPGGLPEHAVLNFVTVERRVRFEASLRAAARARLRLSARLLEVAERVQPP